MPYQFAVSTTQQLQDTFSTAAVIRENSINGRDRCWDFIFISFQKPVQLLPLPDDQRDIVDIIFEGDKAAKACYQANFEAKETSVEAGLRWVAAADGQRIIHATGFAIKIASAQGAQLGNHFINLTMQFLQKFALIGANNCASLQKKIIDAIEHRAAQQIVSEEAKSELLSPCLLSGMQHAGFFVKQTTQKIAPKYIRNNETDVNPCFQELGQVARTLKQNQKLIWLLRSDGKLVAGVKNAYWISFGENELATSLDKSLHKEVNWDDRFGHPSLTDAQDRSAYYGGYVCQRSDHLQIFTSSGRYYRGDLAPDVKKTLEAYLALHFQAVFGDQLVIFYEAPYLDYYELSIFYADQPLPDSTVKMRRYTAESAKKMFEELDCEARTAFLSALHSHGAGTASHQLFANLAAKVEQREKTNQVVQMIFEFAANHVTPNKPAIHMSHVKS